MNDNNETPERPDVRGIWARQEDLIPGPWTSCGNDRGGCKCGLVWSVPMDGVVLTVSHKLDPINPLARLQRHTIGMFAAHAREDVPALLRWVEHLEEKVRVLNQDLHEAEIEARRWQDQISGRSPKEGE